MTRDPMTWAPEVLAPDEVTMAPELTLDEEVRVLDAIEQTREAQAW